MNNQKLPQIAMSKSGHKRERFNFGHDVNTTADFGSVQPAQVKLVVPYSKLSVSTRSLTRLAPMVAPAFGRVKLKIYHEFVACKDVCYSFDKIMAQVPDYSVSANYLSYKTSMPNVPLRFLSSLVLCGAKGTIYKRFDNQESIQYNTFDQNANAQVVTEYQNALNSINIQIFTTDSFTRVPQGDDRWVLSTNIFSGSSKIIMPLSNAAETFKDSSGTSHNPIYDWGVVGINGKIDNNAVTLEEADLVYEFEYNSVVYAVAFRLSSVGKRFRKVLIGCGYQIDLTADSTFVNIMPLFATFKAYWNLFGLTQWQNYESTSLARLLEFLRANDLSRLDWHNFDDATIGAGLVSVFCDFIRDCYLMFYTDSADYVSAHLPSTAVSPASSLSFVDVTSNDSVTEVDSAGSNEGVPSSDVNGHSFISRLEHGELDSEYLQRLYKWTNRNSVIGRRIGEILRAQGLGKFVDSCKTDFIGYTEDYITISDVVSTADTDSGNNTGKLLGEYGGRGLQLTEGKTFTYENDEFGYWITLMVIVPECGYMQQIDPSVFAFTKFALPNPEFDSLGFEAQPKQVVQGAIDWNFGRKTNGDLHSTFGYAPRYFGFKFAPNVNNGDITLRGTRSNYLPYTLDKFVEVQTPKIVKVVGLTGYHVERQLMPNDLPIAGNAYRYIGRYPWLGNFNRIFANVDGDQFTHRMIHWADSDLDWWFFNAHDNFLISSIFNVVGYCPMVAVEDSFETEDTDGVSDMKVTKA